MTSNEAAGQARVTDALSRIPTGLPLIAVGGPTATGKSDWGIRLAREVGGEVISADSRQIYRGLDIGTGKVAGVLDEERGREVEAFGQRFVVAPYVSEAVDHWLIDIAPPDVVVTAAQVQALAYSVIADIAARGHVPVVVGGTGLYVSAIIDGLVMPTVAPDPALRARLENLSADVLAAELLALDPRAGDVVDLRNPRRMVRAIEVARQTGSVAKARGRTQVPFRTMLLGPAVTREAQLERIRRRLVARVEQGLVAEVEALVAAGVTHARFEDLGLEYRYVSRHLRGELTLPEMLDELERAIARFARRQATWFRSHGPVAWLDTVDDAVEATCRFVAAAS